MDLREIRTDESGNKVSFSILSPLVSAILEWILMFLIFVDASFAYLVTRFAHCSKLQIPCLLCSRLDHVLGNEKDGFYWNLICHNHKSKISSLVLCQLHNNLVDLHRTCESCISSINKCDEKKPDESIDSRKCLCCNEQWISTTSIQNLPQLGQFQVKDTDSLPHVEYSKIKVTSDTESDGPFSDNASGIHEMETSGQDSAAKYDFTEPQITTEKLIHLASPIKISLSESEDHTYSHHNVESEAPIGHGLQELQWQNADHNNDVSKPSERSVHPSPNVNDAHYVESNKSNDTSTPELEKEVPVECEAASNLGPDSSEFWKEVNMESRETSGIESGSIPANEICMDPKPNKTDTSSLDLGDAYKLALGTRGRQLSGRLLEQQRSMTESTRASQDLKLLLSQMSFSRGIDLSNDMSPKVSANTEDGAIGMQIFQRRISLERNASNLSLDGSSVSEIEGESEIDRLKRQVEHDKKILVSLYKELEEERNASAIAINQAMAMITRLQEEKAAFHMEALQCVRMMEEQAEYDSEALQKANEMVMEKEKQIQDFEFELELCRSQCEPRPESESDELKDIVKRIDVETKMDRDDSVRISLQQFEDEKQYVLECLKKLEEKLYVFNKHDMTDGPNSTNEVFEASSSDQEKGRTEKSRLRRDEYSDVSKDVDLAALRREFSAMSNRMGALEAEQEVIECSINALKKGSDGFEFIREIAFRLQELHSAHIVKGNEELT